MSGAEGTNSQTSQTLGKLKLLENMTNGIHTSKEKPDIKLTFLPLKEILEENSVNRGLTNDTVDTITKKIEELMPKKKLVSLSLKKEKFDLAKYLKEGNKAKYETRPDKTTKMEALMNNYASPISEEEIEKGTIELKSR